MTKENNLTESEIQELALIYAREKLSRCLDEKTICAHGMQDQTKEELKFLANTYKNAFLALIGISKYESEESKNY